VVLHLDEPVSHGQVRVLAQPLVKPMTVLADTRQCS
jgi:hypothetical protein